MQKKSLAQPQAANYFYGSSEQSLSAKNQQITQNRCTMKKRIFYWTLPLIFLTACSKSKEEPPILFEVFETKTNTPVESVKIDLLRCSNYDLVFGCNATEIVTFGYTDNNGKYSSSQKDYRWASEGAKMSKPNYWTGECQPGKNYIATEATLNLRLLRQNTYPSARVFFRYTVHGEFGKSYNFYVSVPTDTTIKIRAYGNEANTINWGITISNFCIVFPYCSDSLFASGVLNASVDRFGTISRTLNY
jgi:hypothetical protein